MKELGELDDHQAEFAKRNGRVVVVSAEGPELARQTQEQFPHLVVLSDPDYQLVKAADVLHAGAAPDGSDTAAPTTILIDRQGVVKWLYRPDRHIVRLPAKELLTATDEHLKP